MTSKLTAKDILAVEDIDTAEVYVPEWDVTLRVRALTMDEIFQCRKAGTIRRPLPGGKTVEEQDAAATTRALFQLAVVEPAFTADEVVLVFKKKGTAVKRVVDAINKLNPLGDGEEAQKAEAEFQGEQ